MSEFQPKQNPEGATPQRNNLPPQQATPQLAKGDSTEKEEDQRVDKVSQSANLVIDNGNPGAQNAYVNNPSRQHGLQPRQMARTMGRTMNRWGNPLPSGSSTDSQEPLETEAKYPSHQIKMKGDISSARPVAVNVPEESRLSEIQELPPERVIPELQESVGKGGVNRKEDVEIVQYYLLELGLLTETDSITQEAGTLLEEAQIPHLIAALFTFQEEVLHWPNTDGNIGGPASKTLAALKTSTPEQVLSQKEKYPAIKAKREAEAAAKAKADAEAQKKREEEAAKLKASQAAKKKEQERIEKLRNEAASAENAQRYIKEHPNMLVLAAMMKDYAIYNPDLVGVVLAELGRTERDNLTFALLNRLSDAELGATDRTLLTTMKDSLEAWLVTYSSGEYEKPIIRLQKALNVKGQKEEGKIDDKLSPMAEELQKHIKLGENGETKDRLKNLAIFVRSQLEAYPPKVKAFKGQSNYTAEEKLKVLGEIAFETAKMEFLIGSTFYEKGEKWESSNNSGEFVDVYTKKANYVDKEGDEVKSTAPWCAKFVGFIYSSILSTHAINSIDPVRGFWGGSQISGGYEDFFDYNEEEGGEFVGQKKVGENNVWKDLRLEIEKETEKSKKKEKVIEFFGTYFTPQKGDIMITSRTKNNSFKSSNAVKFDTSHTTMIEKLDTSGEDVFLYTIEGNAGDKVTGKRYDLLETSGNGSLASIVNISRMSLKNHAESTELRSKEKVTVEKNDEGAQATFTEVEMVKPLLEMNNMLTDLAFDLRGISKKEGMIYDIKYVKEDNNKVD